MASVMFVLGWETTRIPLLFESVNVMAKLSSRIGQKVAESVRAMTQKQVLQNA